MMGMGGIDAGAGGAAGEIWLVVLTGVGVVAGGAGGSGAVTAGVSWLGVVRGVGMDGEGLREALVLLCGLAGGGCGRLHGSVFVISVSFRNGS